MSGGHVLTLAAQPPDLAAVVALVPLVSGPAAGVHALRSHPARQLVRSGLRGAAARVVEAVRHKPCLIPVVGPPGSPAAFSLPGGEESYRVIAGPTWRNELSATIVLEMGAYRPDRVASRIDVPLLVQIADLDRSAPPSATARAATRARAEIRHYPCDHFYVLSGHWRDVAVADQLAFVSRIVTAPAPPDSE